MKFVVITAISILLVWSMLRSAEVNESTPMLEDVD
jgi:hypothetical protein